MKITSAFVSAMNVSYHFSETKFASGHWTLDSTEIRYQIYYLSIDERDTVNSTVHNIHYDSAAFLNQSNTTRKSRPFFDIYK